MALNTSERTNIHKLIVAMFNAAPGAVYLAEATFFFESTGRSLSRLADALGQNNVFNSLYPTGQTNAQFANDLLGIYRLQDNTEVQNFVATLQAAGISKPQIALRVGIAIDANNSTDPALIAAKAILNNKAILASNYSGFPGDAVAGSALDLPTLQAVLRNVTADPASINPVVVPVVVEPPLPPITPVVIDPPPPPPLPVVTAQTFNLVAAPETLLGTSVNDIFNGATGTLTAADNLNGGAGVDTLNYVHSANGVFPAATISAIEIFNVTATSSLSSTNLSAFAGLTTFNAKLSTSTITATNLASGGVFGAIGNDGVSNSGSLTFGYAAAATAATLNITDGYKSTRAISLFGSGVLATTINVTGATASAVGLISTPDVSTALTINAGADLSVQRIFGNTTRLTVTGTGVVDFLGNQLPNVLVTVDASAQTAGGTRVQAGTSSAFNFTGGAGADTVGLGAVLAGTALVNGGAGTDTLVVGSNSAYITAGTGAFIRNFEVVDVTTATIDLDNLAANNTLTGLRVGGSATVSNLNAATAANVTVYGNATPVINVKGAATVGQSDTVKIDVNDGLATVNTLTLTAPTLTAVETLQVRATDNATITSLANALALTTITVTGAGNVGITTSAIALNAGAAVDASAATGNFTLDATGATANGYNIKGSSGVNVITGGSAPVAVDITRSTTKADQVVITSAAGSTGVVFQTISGFTNAVGTGDKLDVINAGTIAANAAAAATGVANLSGAIANGIITFSGTAAATATLQNKIDAAAALAGITQYNQVAFEHAGNTYVYEQADTTATYAPGVDLVVQLTGVTGVTALSTTASGANTIWSV